jgi:hypothetical protein
MTQLKKVSEPFGEVNIYPDGEGRIRVVATILMEPRTEGAQTGLALDGSGSMSKLYGVDDGSRVLSPIFGGPKRLENQVTPVAQKLCAYLARTLDADGGTTCIYWAVGSGGGEVEVVGDFTADEAERHTFGPPKEFGTGTQLLPAVKYFVERFRSAPWGFYVFVTDGELHDLDEVLAYSKTLARDIAARRRNPVKFVLIGLGSNVNETQMTELDDLDTGTDIDLWDHKLAAEMRTLADIFAEVVDKNARVADNGRILDPQGRVVKDYARSGLPAYLEFEMAAGSAYFTLEVNGEQFHQGLSDQARVPASGRPTPQRPAEPAPKPKAPEPAAQESLAKGRALAREPQKPKEPEPVAAEAGDEADAEWRGLNLELAKPEGEPETDVHLEKQEDEQ